MQRAFNREHGGQIKAVIVDLAGTIVDYGNRTPAGAANLWCRA